MPPSGEKATLLTWSVWSSNRHTSFPSDTRQSLIVLSAEADANLVPSGENANPSMREVWPLSLRSFPSETRQIQMFSDAAMKSPPDPAATHFPSGENTTQFTFSWYCKTCRL